MKSKRIKQKIQSDEANEADEMNERETGNNK